MQESDADVSGSRACRAGARRSRRSLILATTLLVLLLAGCVIGVLLILPSYLKNRVVAEARQRGVELELEDLRIWFGSATLASARLQLIGVSGLRATVDVAEVQLDGWSPRRIDANGVGVDIEGSAADLILELSEWTNKHPHAYRLPISASDVHVHWREAAGRAPWLLLEGGTMSETASGVTFTAKRTRLHDVELGAVGAAWSATSASIAMAFGQRELQHAPVRLEVQHSAPHPAATLTLAPTPAEVLAAPLGVPLPVAGVTASGKAELVLPTAFEDGPIRGHVELLLDGYVPPHPVELSGFHFGDRTIVRTDLEVTPDRRRVRLRNTGVAAGAFRLSGRGEVTRRDESARIQLSLDGKLPCSAVARSAAQARLGTALGALLGDAARRVVDGTIAINVEIDADTRDLAAAEVQRKIGVGCGLRPLSGSDLARLGIQENVDALRQRLPSTEEVSRIPRDLARKVPPLPSALPPLPSALPPLPELRLPRLRPTPAGADDEGRVAPQGE